MENQKYAYLLFHKESWNEMGISVNKVTTDWTTAIRSPVEVKDFCWNLLWSTHPIQWVPGGKARPKYDANHSLSSNAAIKNEWELYIDPLPKRLHGV